MNIRKKIAGWLRKAAAKMDPDYEFRQTGRVLKTVSVSRTYSEYQYRISSGEDICYEQLAKDLGLKILIGCLAKVEVRIPSEKEKDKVLITMEADVLKPAWED